MNKYYFLFSITLLLLGCKETKTDVNTYFSGQIINPKEEGIYLYQNEKVIGHSNLNAKNQFSIKLKNLKEGLYTFSHGDEFQYVYLEPQDSLIMRLNSWDFDESLIFSGKGADKNNFLIHLFLDNEKDNKLFSSYYNLNETAFLQKTDSLLKDKILQYEHFKNQTSVHSKSFNDLIEITIKDPFYAKKETYSIIDILNAKSKKIKTVSEQFYSYRNNADLNPNKYANYYAHRIYLINRVLNETYTRKSNYPKENLSIILLDQINKNIKDPILKNDMLYKSITKCLLDKTCSITDKNNALQVFYKNCSNNLKIKKVITLENSLKNLTKNSKLPKIALINYNNKKLNILNVIKDNTIIYFWPKEKNRIKNLAKRVHYLVNKHPHYTFIGLDNQQSNTRWKSYIKKLNLNNLNQYQLIDTTKNKWFVNDIPRTIIVNKRGIILNDFTYLSDSKFELLLK